LLDIELISLGRLEPRNKRHHLQMGKNDHAQTVQPRTYPKFLEVEPRLMLK